MKNLILFRNIAYKSTLFSFSLLIFISACELNIYPTKSVQITSFFTEPRIPSTTMPFISLSPTITQKLEPTNTPIPFPTSTYPPYRWISTGPNGGGAVWAIAINPALSSIIYAGTSGNNSTLGQGVFKTLDGGRSWIPSNAGISEEIINALVIDPKNPSIIYAGIIDMGVFRSIDQGDTWQPMNVGLSTGIATVFIYTLAIDPQAPSTLYAGTDLGIFKSSFISSNGKTVWKSVNSGIPNSYDINSIVIDPHTTTTLYAGATKVLTDYTEGIIIKSVDGGDHWNIIKSGLKDDNFVIVAIDPINTSTIYYGIKNDIYKSTDGGNSWRRLNMGLQEPRIMSFAIDPMTPSTVYTGTDGNGVYKSVDSGKSWKALNDGLSGDSLHVYSLAINPATPSLVYAGTYNGVYSIYQSSN